MVSMTYLVDCHRNFALIDKYEGTYINGMNVLQEEERAVAANLNESYGIPVTFFYNWTNKIAHPTIGGGMDLLQCAEQTGFNVLLFATPTQLEPCTRGVVTKWEKLKDEKKDIVHFTHSQGGILTDAALWRFRLFHPFSFVRVPFTNIQMSSNKYVNARMHVIVMASGWAYLDRFVLPPDTHFVYTNQDICFATVGLRWNPLNWFGKRKQSWITDYPIINYLIFEDWDLTSAHTFIPEHDKPNTYGWWTYFVGGPIFQLNESGHSIHGDKWWLSFKEGISNSLLNICSVAVRTNVDAPLWWNYYSAHGYAEGSEFIENVKSNPF
jgi:hypothetical protein